jgi:dipeptidyl aminopeptidase/acylaminoacyl peptidase
MLLMETSKHINYFLQVAHPDKIAVGGHSYGAFMTANLLAHAPHLFCCGIARSGAYNRTLTPFGFQVPDLIA